MRRSIWTGTLALLVAAGCGGRVTRGSGGQDHPLFDGAGSGRDGVGGGRDGTGGGPRDVAYSEAGLPFVDGSVSRHIVTSACPGCPPFPGSFTEAGPPRFGSFGNAPACSGAGVDPTLVYPNDGALYPPNMNVIEVQFLPGSGNTLFEVDFENALTDVRVETRCVPITNSVGVATGGCSLSLDATTWDYIATNNAGGAPLTVTVRGTPDESCVAGSNSRTMLFAEQPLQGVVYYWQSVVNGTSAGTAGGIFRYNFGTRAPSPSPFLVPSTASGFAGKCLGCHFISRDGQKMTFGEDDSDADDEYSDLATSLLDVATYAASPAIGSVTKLGGLAPGFQTFALDHSVFLASDGKNANSASPAFFLYQSATGAAATPATVPSGMRGTQPDWSDDGSKIVFVEPGTVFSSGKGNCNCAMGPPAGTCPAAAPYDCTCTAPTAGNLFDNHFAGGSLFTMGAASDTSFGTPAALFASTGENNYYPAWAPDSAYILFNRVIGVSGLAQDSFSNPLATVWAIAAGGGAPVELAKLETGGVDATRPLPSGGLTNSWPRFSPFVQNYHGKKLYWVTFSSTRDYGVRVQNQVPGEVNCYPPESPLNPCSGKTELVQPNCAQPQIWMAAVTEDALASGDTSFPAFWLPFQSLAAHNHIAQWATTLVGAPTPDAGISVEAGTRDARVSTGDAGACVAYNGSCTASSQCCSGLTCVSPSNTCQLVIQ